jgi:dTMP kinase
MAKNKKFGSYIVFEGLDASGKSTQAQMLMKDLEKRGQTCQFIAEPGGTAVGNKIRAILKDGSLERTPESNLDLFTICRREIVAQKIGPTILSGVNIISDRNWWSSVAYQSFGEGIDKELVIEKSKKAMGDYFMPDYMILIDTPVDVIHHRMHSRGGKAEDYFEKKGIEFFERARQGYLWLASRYKIATVNGDQSVEEVYKEVIARLGI